MKIAIDESPIRDAGHKVRGVGFYLTHLEHALLSYFPDQEYMFFTADEGVPKNAEIIHYPYFDPFFVTLPNKRLKKTIVTVHDLTPLIFPEHFPAGIRGKLRWLIQKRRLHAVDVIITDSEASKKDIHRLTGISDKKIQVVYLAAGEEFTVLPDKGWKDDLRKKYDLPEKFLLYVGDVTWNKNLPRLLRGLQDSSIPLVLVGKALASSVVDSQNPWVKDQLLAQKLIKEHSQFTTLGFVPTEDLVKLYNLATAFVFPSLYEGFGLPVLEAMQSGCPVVTTHEGSLKEVAGEAAYMVDAYSESAMKDGIEKVWNDVNLQEQLRKKGLIHARKFTWKKTAEFTLKAYEV